MTRKLETRILASNSVSLMTREDQPPQIVGYASVFYDGTPGTQYQLWEGCVERVMPGAFARAMAEDDVRGLFNHDPNLILGRNKAGTMRLTEDGRGLRYSIDPPDTQAGRDAQESLRRGDVTGSSFSFITTDERWIKEDGLQVREIRGVQLWDVGPVTFPAYEGTTASARAAGDVAEARAAYERWQAEQLHAEREAVDVRLRALEVDEASG